jgi:hypothetical protein
VAELHLPEDYVDLLKELDAARADYLLIGGWAVAVHGHGRATDDLDVFVRATPDNAARVMIALKRFGAPIDAHGVTEALFAKDGYGYRMGRKPVLIELLTTIDGVTFDEAQERRVLVEVAGIQVPVIGRDALLANKRAAGRPKDLADIEALTRDA